MRLQKDTEGLSRDVEPRRRDVTAMLSRQGAMLEELRVVVYDIAPETARSDLRRLILEDNVLRRGSLSSRREIFRKLGERYFRRETRKATALFLQAIRDSREPSHLALLAYVMFLWNDALAFTLSVEWLAPKLQGDGFTAETSDILRELQFLEKQIPAIRGWGETTRKRIGRHYLGLLRDCGFAVGSARKMLRKPYVAPEVALFAAQLIAGSGEPLERLPQHGLFTAMGLSVDEVIDSLYELDRQRRVRFAVQGGVVHLELRGERQVS